MTWRDRYRQASFRGVPFLVESAEGDYGRRQVINQYPEIDEPGIEDTGKDPDGFQIEGYLIGDDYDLELERLIDVCSKQAGPGQLVHPYRGEKSVRCMRLRTRETTLEGRMVRLQFTFIEEGKVNYPTTRNNPISLIGGKAGNLIGAVKAGFTKAYKVAGFIGSVRDSAVAQVKGFSDFMGQISDPFKIGINDAVAFSYEVKGLFADATALVNTPGKLADRIGGLLGLIEDTFQEPEKVFKKIIGQYTSSSSSSGSSSSPVINYPTTTPSRKQQATNTLQFAALVRQVAISEAARVAAAAEYPSYQDAYVARETIATELDGEAVAEVGPPIVPGGAGQPVSDDVYIAIVDLQAEVVRGIPPEGERLPQLRSVQYNAALPAVVIAYALYEDALRDAEIVARNNVRHPGYMPGGRPIQVIANG